MRRLALVALLLAPFLSPVTAQAQVRLIVRVPPGTPASEPIYLAGGKPSMGGWKADGVRLYREENGAYAAELDLAVGEGLEFKITRGTWGTVEKNPDGSDRPNRFITIERPNQVIEAKVEAWGEGAGVGSVTGQLRQHLIKSESLGGERRIRVWLPPGYDDRPEARYGVLYMHDGQNCFDKATSTIRQEWEIDETMTRLIGSGRVRPLIVVGLDHGGASRIDEYTFTRDERRGGGRGAAHESFLLKDVRPFIEKEYRVLTGPTNTLIGGSSLGATASLEIAQRNPGLFGGVIAMSGAFSWDNGRLVTQLEKDAGGLAGARVWLDMGTRERAITPMGEPVSSVNQELLNLVRRLGRGLSAQAIENEVFIEEGGEHHEQAWARRFERAILMTAPPER
jgi:predicted alpha/beta superfamily hydrolase